MTPTQISTTIQEGQAIGDTILNTIEGLDPAVDVPAAEAGTILDLSSQLVQKALTAYSAAAGVPIDQASILALLPNPVPLSAPTS